MDASDSDTDSYAGSAASITVIEEDSEVRVAEQIEKAFDPLPLDRAMVVEARHSGLINAITRDLERLKKESQVYCDSCANDLAKWQSLVKKTEANVEWLKARVGSLVAKKKAAVPVEYAQAETELAPREDTIG